jgi:hypothetical protein
MSEAELKARLAGFEFTAALKDRLAVMRLHAEGKVESPEDLALMGQRSVRSFSDRQREAFGPLHRTEHQGFEMCFSWTDPGDGIHRHFSIRHLDPRGFLHRLPDESWEQTYRELLLVLSLAICPTYLGFHPHPAPSWLMSGPSLHLLQKMQGI